MTNMPIRLQLTVPSKVNELSKTFSDLNNNETKK